MLIPSVHIYSRRHSTRKYERVRTRNPQMLGAGDSYCLHVWFKGKRNWITVDGDLNAALRRRMEEETELILEKKEEATKEPPRLRVEDAVRNYLTKVEAIRSEATYTGYDYALKEFRKVCKKEFLADITRRDLRAGASPETLTTSLVPPTLSCTLAVAGVLTSNCKSVC